MTNGLWQCEDHKEPMIACDSCIIQDRKELLIKILSELKQLVESVPNSGFITQSDLVDIINKWEGEVE